jgi:hypothetical protein
MEMTEELCACLALQNDIASNKDEVMRRLKAVIEGERNRLRHFYVAVAVRPEKAHLSNEVLSEGELRNAL